MSRVKRIAALFLTVGLLAACGNTDNSPNDGSSTGSGSSGNLVDSPFGKVLAWSATSPDKVWAVTTADDTCDSCAALWQKQEPDAEWQRVHTFAEPKKPGRDDDLGEIPPVTAGGLVMAPDGEHGLFRWDTDGVLTTDDGGQTWAHLPDPLRPEKNAKAYDMVVRGDYFFIVTNRSQIWRTETTSMDWEQVTPKGVDGIFELYESRGGLGTHDLGTNQAWTTTDDGDTWKRIPAGRFGQNCLPGVTTPDRLVATCSAFDESDWVEVSKDRGETWRRIYSSGYGTIGNVVSGPGGTYLVETGSGRTALVSGDGSTTKLPLQQWSADGEVGFVGDTTILHSAWGLLSRSDDNGRTWQQISPSRKAG